MHWLTHQDAHGGTGPGLVRIPGSGSISIWSTLWISSRLGSASVLTVSAPWGHCFWDQIPPLLTQGQDGATTATFNSKNSEEFIAFSSGEGGGGL